MVLGSVYPVRVLTMLGGGSLSCTASISGSLIETLAVDHKEVRTGCP
jgi:hypothetical protein